jgi:hypothetical protein
MLIPVCFSFWDVESRGAIGSDPKLLSALFQNCLQKATEFSPKLLAPYINSIFSMLQPVPGEKSVPEYRSNIAQILTNLYRYDKPAFGNHVALIFEALGNTEVLYKTTWIMVITDMCKNPLVARKVLPFVEALLTEAEEGMKGSMGYMVISALADCAKSVGAVDDEDSDFTSNPLLPLLPRIKTICIDDPLNVFTYLSCISACGLTDRGELGKMLGRVLEVLQMNTSPDINSMCLVEMLAMRPDKEALEPMIDIIRSLEGGDAVSGHGRESAHMLVQIYEGRDLSAVVERVAAIDRAMHDLNNNMKEMCSNIDEVEKYVQDNIADVKQFLGTVVKKLPNPNKLTVEGKVRKTLLLHFSCCRHSSGECMHPPGGNEFTTKTKAWNKWLKMGFSLAQAGLAVVEAVGEGDAEGAAMAAGGACKSIYNSFKEKDDADFNTYISEPFLMSADRDKLLAQLEESSFFGVFSYDAQVAGWTCPNCVAEGEVKTADGMIMQKPRDDAPKDDPVVKAYEAAVESTAANPIHRGSAPQRASAPPEDIMAVDSSEAVVPQAKGCCVIA